MFLIIKKIFIFFEADLVFIICISFSYCTEVAKQENFNYDHISVSSRDTFQVCVSGNLYCDENLES